MRTTLFLLTLFFITFSKADLLFETRIGRACSKSNLTVSCGYDLVCLDRTGNVTIGVSGGTCQYCKHWDQCLTHGTTYDCKKAVNKENEIVHTCQHKDLLPRITWFDIFASITAFLGSASASAGGIGGGGIYVPILYAVGQFPLDLCIPISKTMVLGGALANLAILMRESHPHAGHRHLIYFEPATLFEPSVLLGTTIGVICNTMFPSWLIVLLLILIISVMTIRVFIKGIFQSKGHPKDESLLDPTNVDGYETLETEDTKIEKVEGHEEKLERVKEGEGSFPWLMLLVLGICWIIVFTFALLKGGHGAKSIIGVLPCSLPWWIFFASSFPILITVIGLFAVYLFFDQKHKFSVGWKPVKGDIVWNPITLFLYPTVFVLAGFFASLLGIGSGMLKAPFLVELGLEPVVAAATSNYMIFWTASITVAQYALLGRIPADYGLWFGCIGFASALLGQFVIGYLVKKYNKQSFIVLVLGGVMFLSILLMGGLGISKVVNAVQIGEYMGFKSPC